MSTTKCEGCGENVPSYEITHYGSMESSYKQLCSRCLNAEVVKLSGFDDFDSTRLHPIGITDCMGESHEFHFVSRLLGNMATLEAFEVQDGGRTGYQFELIGDPDANMFSLFGVMVERIRKALSVKHIKDTENGHGLQIVDQTVCGRIDYDPSSNSQMPCMIVDGREISWEDFGRMLSSFEGWQFKLDIFDRSDELYG
jgi:hypothetical protein